ncbi:MAG: hypothetical protein K1Y36_25790 [Blastocatellia bacterium]|nr:hypothetical protein [Blastocatellia bacterium]
MKKQRTFKPWQKIGVLLLGFLMAACTINVPPSNPQPSIPAPSTPVSPRESEIETKQLRKEATRQFCQELGKSFREMDNFKKAHSSEKPANPDEVISQLRSMGKLLGNTSKTIQALPTLNVDTDAVTAAAETSEKLGQFGALLGDLAEIATDAKSYAEYNRSPEAAAEFLLRLVSGNDPSDLVDEHLTAQKEIRQRLESFRTRFQVLAEELERFKAKMFKLKASLQERYGEDMLPDDIMK